MIDIFTSVFSRSLVNISSNLFISNKYQHVLFVLILLYTTSVSCQLPCLSNRLTSDGGNYKYQNILDYTSDMCSQCYSFILSPGLNLIPKPGTNGTKLQRPLYYYVMPNTGLLCMTNKPQKAYCNFALPEKFNRTHPHKDWFLSTFKTNFHLNAFLRCCDDAVNCCTSQLNNSINAGSNSSEELFCPRKWDGWDCWPETKAGTAIEQICPLMSLQSHFRDLPDCLKGYSFKSCQSDGNWFRLPDTQTEKTNYAYCSFVGRSKSLAEIYLRLVLHSISLVFISISVIIFIYFEQHKIVRIRIHLNLFASLAIYSISDIIFYTIIRWSHLTDISDNILKDNSWWCVLQTVLVKTSKLTNYCWMLCEGLYLYKLIVHAFHEQIKIGRLYLVGWLLPIVAMVPYVIVHSQEPFNNKCWIESMGQMEWIYYPLPLICLSINCILLSRIGFVLFMKLRSTPDHLKTALRATLILVPVFGIHYMFFVTQATMVDSCDLILQSLFYIAIAADSLQGAIVAMIFCLFNSEVHGLIKRSIKRRQASTQTEQMDLMIKVGTTTSTI